MGSKSAPKTPDYRGAAEEQGESAQQNTTTQTYANRPNQTTPWGSSTWTNSSTIDPSTGKPVTSWNQDITLSPSEQASFDSQSRIRAGLSEGAESLVGQATESFATPYDRSQLPDYAATPATPQNAYSATTLDIGVAPTPESDYSTALARGTGPQVQDRVTSNVARGTAPTVQGAVSSNMQRGNIATASDSALIGARDFAAGPNVTGMDATTNQFGGYTNPNSTNALSEQSLNAGGNYNPNFASTQYNRQMSLEGPRMARATAALDGQLRNQGLAPGTEAYDTAMNDLRNQQGEQTSRMAQDAMRLGAQEQQAQFGRELSTRQQGAQEVDQSFGRGSTASKQQDAQRYQQFQEQQTRDMQRYNQELSAAGFSDQQRQQMVQQKMADNEQQFSQQMQQANLMDSQRAADFGEQLSSGAQLFSQQLSAGQYADSQREADIAQQLRTGAQQYSQQLGAGAYADSQREADLANTRAVADQTYRQGLAGAEFADSQRSTDINQRLAAGGQTFNQDLQGADYQNTLRQSKLVEDMQARGMTINEINALLSGNQIGLPSMPGFDSATKADATQYGNAAADQGQFANQRYATALSPINSALSAAGQLGSTYGN